MRKRVVSIMLCVAMCATTLVGCGNTNGESAKDNGQAVEPTETVIEEDSEAGTEKADGEAVTITYGCWDDNQAKLIRTIADEFEEKNPTIDIEIQVNGWDDYWTALEAAATGGALPDAFWMHSNNIYYYGANDQLLDLTDYIAKSDKVSLDKYPEGLTKIYNVNDKQYAIPKDYDTIGLWYNKTMFDEAGVAYPDDTWTWDTLKEAAKKLTKEDKSQYGICFGLENQQGYYNFAYQNGGEIITTDKKSGYDNEKTIAGVDQYLSFVREGLSPEVYDASAIGEAMTNGLAAMGFFGSWYLSTFASSDYMKENFDVAVLPSSNDGKRASLFNGLGNAISATTEHPDEAWKWVEYLSSEEGQKRQAELGIAISAYEGAADKFVDAYPMFHVKNYIDMVEYAQIRPYSNQTSVWEDKANEYLKDAYAGKITTKEACEKAAEFMNEALSSEE